MNHQDTILYDNDCGFCDWCRDLVEKYDYDQRYTFVGMRDPRALEIASQAGQTIDPDSPESFIIHNAQAGIWLEKSRAAKEITKHLSGPLHLFYYVLLIAPPVLADWGYKRIANNRHRLGPLVGRKTCRMR